MLSAFTHSSRGNIQRQISSFLNYLSVPTSPSLLFPSASKKIIIWSISIAITSKASVTSHNFWLSLTHREKLVLRRKFQSFISFCAPVTSGVSVGRCFSLGNRLVLLRSRYPSQLLFLLSRRQFITYNLFLSSHGVLFAFCYQLG